MKTKPNGFWNVKTNCYTAALECTTRSEFAKKYSQAYSNTLKNNWQYEFFVHMSNRKKWVKEECQKMVLKCKSRSEFAKKYAGAYKAARKNNWLDDICKNMVPIGNIFNKMIYVWLFPDNHFYVGQTCNFMSRSWGHFNDLKSAVYQHIKKTKLKPKKIIISNYIPVKEAIKLEKSTEKKYIALGFISLNKTVPGSVGGKFHKWNKEKCQMVALKCKNRREFCKKYGGAYKAARINKWLDEICGHMITQKPNGYYTKERCQELALRCKTKTEFCNNYSTAYNVVCKNRWIDDICSHMLEKRKPNGYWTKEKCHQASLKCKYKSEFKKNYSGAYHSARINNWLQYISIHLISKRNW